MKHHFDTAGEYLSHLLTPAKKVFATLTDYTLLKALLAGAMATCHAFFTDHLEAVMVLVTLVVIDQITGVVCACHRGQFSSSKFRHGIIKLAMYLLLIVAFHVAGSVLGMAEVASLDKFAILYLTATEAFSIVENVQCSTGMRLPKWMGELLKSVGKRKP